MPRNCTNSTFKFHIRQSISDNGYSVLLLYFYGSISHACEDEAGYRSRYRTRFNIPNAGWRVRESNRSLRSRMDQKTVEDSLLKEYNNRILRNGTEAAYKLALSKVTLKTVLHLLFCKQVQRNFSESS